MFLLCLSFSGVVSLKRTKNITFKKKSISLLHLPSVIKRCIFQNWDQCSEKMGEIFHNLFTYYFLSLLFWTAAMNLGLIFEIKIQCLQRFILKIFFNFIFIFYIKSKTSIIVTYIIFSVYRKNYIYNSKKIKWNNREKCNRFFLKSCYAGIK